MTTTFITFKQQFFSCRVVATANQAGTYFNGASNTGCYDY